jgi:amidase
VRDTARVLDAIAGPGIGDPYVAPRPERPFAQEVGADPGRLRIGFRTAATETSPPTHPDCVAAVAVATTALEQLGHHVEEVELRALDDPRFGHGVSNVFSVFVAGDLARWSTKLGRALVPSDLEPFNAMMAEVGAATTAVAYAAGIEALQAYGRGLQQWWADGNDVLVTPMLTKPPFALGWLGPDVDPGELFGRLAGVTSFSMPFNVTGQPAISLPLHWNDAGLPIHPPVVD